MQFDSANGGNDWGWGRRGGYVEPLTETNYQAAKRKFAKQGYNIPQIIFWNVNAHSSLVPVRKDEVGTALVSGLTPAIFENVLSGDILNPEKHMIETLYQEKYDFVRELFK